LTAALYSSAATLTRTMKTPLRFLTNRLLWSTLFELCSALAHAETVQVAVASNFSAPMQKIAMAFERDTGHTAALSFGATGKFYAQIRNGAPFAVLLAADDETPARLVQEGLAMPGSAFTYAIGQLVLWSAQTGLVDEQGRVLDKPLPGKLAVADPKLAPYGAAAMQVIRQRGLGDTLHPHLVVGENIGQTFQFVKTGNAALGFVALSQVMVDGKLSAGSAWRVPNALYEPIRQDAVLLKAGEHSPAAQALLQYLRGDAARQVIRAYGYQF
jgi:molybdate transport system substrate-binding protein